LGRVFCPTFIPRLERTEMKKILVIEDTGKFVRFKNSKVTDSEFKQIKVSMDMSDIQKWHLKEDAGNKEKIIDNDIEVVDQSIIEELEDTPDTVLGRLMKQGDSE
jgi:hypothetical protein